MANEPITNKQIEQLRDRFSAEFTDVFEGMDIAVVAMLLAYEGATACALASTPDQRRALAQSFRDAFEDRFAMYADIRSAWVAA